MAKLMHGMAAIPAGVSIRLRRITLLDLFLVEHIPDLKMRLDRLFSGSLRWDFDESFSKILGGMSYGGWMRLGSIGTAMTIPGIGRRVSHPSEIPEGVEYVEFSAQKLLPSLVLLQIDLFVGDTLADELNALTATPAPANFAVTKFDMRRLELKGWVEAPWSTRDQIEAWSESLRSEVEQSLQLGREGEFRDRQRPRLPAIESYLVTDSRTRLTSIGDWADANSNWLYLRGFEMSGFSQYASNDCLFCWSTEHSASGHSIPPRLLAFRGATDDRHDEALERALKPIAPGLALVAWTESVRNELEQLRGAMFAMQKRRGTRQLTHYIRLSEAIHTKALTLEGVMSESARGLSHYSLLLGDSGLTLVHKHARQVVATDLAKAATDVFKRNTSMLKDEASRMRRMFSDFVAARNMEATYRLQWFVIVLTIVAAIVNGPAFITGLVWLRDNWSTIFRAAKGAMPHWPSP